ncbi:hypothetical protein [Nitrosopumilus sp.]|uniref:hypothetical protein n=1 Tax=Nitrosopumilus sp. TaxID=2024843 RepID=UPI002603A7AE|nr:hypothetical protein [Nitrosopumilus sp.]
MISFENRVLYEYKIKTSKIDTLVKSITTHRDPKSQECIDASKFLDVLISEIDQFYKSNDDILSNNGKRPHPRSGLPEVKKWNENVEKFFEKNPRRRPRSK